MGSSNTKPHRTIQNFHLVWLDENIDEANKKGNRKSITKLRQVINTVNTFVDVNKCVNFINGMKEEKVFIILSDALGQTAVPLVHDKTQVNAIYILCGNKVHDEEWIEDWPKIKGVYTDIDSICQALNQAAKDYDQNSISMSFIKKSDEVFKETLDTFDHSFVYTQILKEILPTINFKSIHVNQFLTYCREQFVGNEVELKHIDMIKKDDRRYLPIWLYTYDWFLYSIFNTAIRTMEIDLIIKMGFFLKDLHNYIIKLHAEQFDKLHHSDTFTVYRGQSLSRKYFDELQQTQGGLLSFNSFLSTNKNSAVALKFVRRTIYTSDLVGVIFVIKIDPSITTVPFGYIKDVNYHKIEEGILFSMQPIFRIGHIQQIEGDNRLWQVDLRLISRNDPQLHSLTERIHRETYPHLEGWDRLGMFLTKLGQFNKAQELYKLLLQQTTGKRQTAHLYHMLGMVNNSQSNYKDAVEYYEKSIKIKQHILSSTDSDLAISYSELGKVYYNMNEYLTALSYHEKALEIRQKTLPTNHPDFLQSYSNIGNAYGKMGEHSKALSYYEKDLKIDHKTLPTCHPDMAESYSNIGNVYSRMGEHSKALSYYIKALEIYRKILPTNHPDLVTSYNNIAAVHYNMQNRTKALSYYEKALEIKEKILPKNPSDLASSYNNIAVLYGNRGEYSKALSYYEKACAILEKTIPVNDSLLATVYINIGSVYENMHDYTKALSYYEHALDIKQHLLPHDHSHLESLKESIEIVKKKL